MARTIEVEAINTFAPIAEDVVTDYFEKRRKQLPVPGIVQPAMERRKRALLQQPPYLHRMQMEGGMGVEDRFSQQGYTTLLNPDDVTWDRIAQQPEKPPAYNLQELSTLPPSSLKEEKVEGVSHDYPDTLLEQLSGFMSDDMDRVLDYVDESSYPYIQYMSRRVDDVMDLAAPTMEHPGSSLSCPVPNLT